MINIKTNFDGKGTKIECEVRNEGRKTTVCEFYGIIKALTKIDNDAFTDALGKLVDDKFDEILGGHDDDESES